MITELVNSKYKLLIQYHAVECMLPHDATVPLYEESQNSKNFLLNDVKHV